MVRSSAPAGPWILIAAPQQREAARLDGLFAQDGIPLVVAHHSDEVMALVGREACTLALVDVDLPGLGGIELCRRLNREPERTIPLLLWLDDDNRSLILRGLEAGALGYLSRASKVDEVYLSLRNHLRAQVNCRYEATFPCIRDQSILGHWVLDALPDAVLIADHKQCVVDANVAMLDQLGRPAAALLSLELGEVFGLLSIVAEAQREILSHLGRYGAWRGEVHGRHPDGREAVFWLHARSVQGQCQGSTCRFSVFHFADIGHLKHRERQWRTLAETDALTGLANRNLFFSRLSQAIEAAEKGGLAPSIIFIDLDEFKQVNDRLGHGYGDRVLREIADRLQSGFRPGDLVARLGGDEFAVIMVGSSDQVLEESARRLLDRLVIRVPDSFGDPIEVTCSLGIAVYPRDGLDAPSLLKVADQAMYLVKGQGKRGYCFASRVGEAG